MQQIPARWERWTIDELLEGLARVLVSTARRPLEAAQLSKEFLDETSKREQRRAVSSAVMSVELGAARETWTDERDVYLRLVSLPST